MAEVNALASQACGVALASKWKRLADCYNIRGAEIYKVQTHVNARTCSHIET